MSPSEFDLRAALRDGEGDGIDPGTVIFRARELRRQRRVRFASTAAVVAVVAGIGVGSGVVLTGGGTGPNHGSSDSRATGKAGDAAGGSTRSGAPGYDANAPSAPAEGARATALPCPAALPRLAAPASGGGALFPAQVVAVKICAYPESSGPPITDAKGQPVTAVLTGNQAAALAASLDAADRTRAELCPQYRSADGKTLVVIGIAAGGAAMPPVTAVVAQNPCNSPVTNGTAVRYNWTPPDLLTGYLGEVQAAGTPRARSLSPSSKVIPAPPTR